MLAHELIDDLLVDDYLQFELPELSQLFLSAGQVELTGLEHLVEFRVADDGDRSMTWIGKIWLGDGDRIGKESRERNNDGAREIPTRVSS